MKLDMEKIDPALIQEIMNTGVSMYDMGNNAVFGWCSEIVNTFDINRRTVMLNRAVNAGLLYVDNVIRGKVYRLTNAGSSFILSIKNL